MPASSIATLGGSVIRQLGALTARWPILAKLAGGPASSVGLDIGSTSVKVAVVTRASNGFTVVKFATTPIPPQADHTQRTQAVQQAMSAIDGPGHPSGGGAPSRWLGRARVVIAVGGPGSVLRWVVLPKMTPQELKVSLAFEAEKHIPFKLEEAFLDFAIIGDRPGGRMEILLASARKELVNAQVALLEAAARAPHVVDLEPVALANSWAISHPGGGSEVVGLIHVGARGTIVDIVSGSQLQFSREIPLGGDAFTQAVAEGLQLDGVRAEAIKCQPGERAGDVRAALQPRWDEWLAQCRASFDFYEDQSGHGVGTLRLTGGSARLAGFRERIQEATGLPTEVWNPLKDLACACDPREVEASGTTLAIAIGLAARGVGE